jgi:hypothetical protein
MMTTHKINAIHHGMGFDEYRGLPYISKSGLVDFLRSPGFYRHRQGVPFEGNKYTLFGSALDCVMTDGPKAFDAEYSIRPAGVDLRTKAGKQWKAEQEGKTPLTADEGRRIQECHDRVLAYPPAAELLTESVQTQISIVWEDTASGVTLKGRPDFYLPPTALDSPIITDLKSTGEGDPDSFGRTFAKFRYHWQAALYCAGMTAITGVEHYDFRFIVVERDAPHRVEVYKCDEGAIHQAMEEIAELLPRYRRCCETDIWPVSTGALQDVSLPPWAMR